MKQQTDDTLRLLSGGKSIPALLVGGVQPLTFFIGAATVLFGSSAATLRGNLEVLPASLCLVFTILCQIAGFNLHRYYDISHRLPGHEHDDETLDSFDQVPRSSIFREGCSAFSILAVMIGLAMLSMGGWPMLIFGVLVAVIAWFTFAGPRPLFHTPWALLSTFLLFGPVGVIGTSLIQSAHESSSMLNNYDLAPALYVSLVSGIMAANCQLVYFITFCRSVRNPKSLNLVCVCGRKTSAVISVVLSLLWSAIYIIGLYRLGYTEWVFIWAPPIVSVIYNFVLLMFARHPVGRRRKIQFAVNAGMCLFAIAIFVLTLIYGNPDDSAMRYF